MIPVAILAGGLATRLRPLTETVPKSLIEIAGQPFLAHQLRLLKQAGASRVVLCVGYLGERIREFAGDGRRFGLEIEYSFDGPRSLGTGGALLQALPLLGNAFFVLYGDSYLRCDYRHVERVFLESGKLGLMTVFRNEGLWDASNVEFSKGSIVGYDKQNPTPEMHYIDYGLGAFRAEVFRAHAENHPHDLSVVYQDILRRKELAGYEVAERFYEIGSSRGIQELEGYFRESKRRAVFLDRDGVLNQAIVRAGRPYPPATIAELQLISGAPAALRKLKDVGFVLIVITNQPDVARGAQMREIVEEINQRVGAAVPVDGFYVCFHDGADGCGCRKPRPGLLLAAADDWNIDLGCSFLIGDRWRDIDAGAAAGCRTALIDYGYEERAPENKPGYRARSLAEAVDWILGQLGESVT